MKPPSLPDDIYSPDKVSAVILDLNEYQSLLRTNAARKRAGADIKAATKPSPLLQIALESAGLTDPTPDNLDELRKHLETILAKSPTAHITLAALPNLAIKKRLTAWFRTEISPNLLVSFSVRSDIGGGAVVRTGSHIYDFSYRNLLIANKQKLAEIVSRVR